ncbi:MAG: B12-binding domain-containing radical SAM protein [Thermoplasmataceae archaeon]
MKVLVANPPAYLWDEGRRYVQGGSRWSHSTKIDRSAVPKMLRSGRYPYTPYPFYLGYAASYLSSVADVSFVDGVILNYNQDDFKEKAKEISPDLLVLETPTVSFPLTMRLVEEIKKELDVKVAVAGSHISARHTEEMTQYTQIDFSLVNEYEETLMELVEKNLKPEDVRGLTFRSGTKVKFNGLRQVRKDISEYPFPFRDSSIAYYDDFTLTGHPNIQMLSSRGCPVGCNFCYTTVYFENPIYRPRKPENIVEEINELVTRFRPKQLYFDDDTISINPKHISELSRALIREKVDIPWTCMADITVKREVVDLMKKAGCIGMKFGVESVSPDTLKRMHKGIVTEEKTLRFRKMLKEMGLLAHATFSLGHPGDSRESILSTIKFAGMLKPNSLQVSMATPLPGTHFYNEAVNSGWLSTTDWNEFDGTKGSVLNYPHLSKEDIDQLYSLFWDEWRKTQDERIFKAGNMIKKRKLEAERIFLRLSHKPPFNVPGKPILKSSRA